nr:MAG TPA: hypothetical protein [Caudoviricetes sp.]
MIYYYNAKIRIIFLFYKYFSNKIISGWRS